MTESDTMMEGNGSEATGLPENVEFVSNEERKAALDAKAESEYESNIQVAEDHQMLQEIMAERDLTAEDCELVKDPTFKEDCLMSI